MTKPLEGKVALQTLLAPFVQLRTQHPVSAPPQFADVFVASKPLDPQAARLALGHLVLIILEPAMIEAYSGTASSSGGSRHAGSWA